MADGNDFVTKNTDAEIYIEHLTEEQKMLVILKKELYGGSWEPMVDDLHNRLEGKPYIFKLANRIQNDIERIEEMIDFENQNNLDLAEFVQLA